MAPSKAMLNLLDVIHKRTEQHSLGRLDPAVLLCNSDETCGGASVLYNPKDVPCNRDIKT